MKDLGPRIAALAAAREAGGRSCRGTNGPGTPGCLHDPSEGICACELVAAAPTAPDLPAEVALAEAYYRLEMEDAQ